MDPQEELLHNIIERLDRIEDQFAALPPAPITDRPMLNWTLSKTDLIELIYALHSSGAFNRGAATITQISRFFESSLHIQLGNTSVTFQEILRRKDSTAFLQKLKEKLDEHIDKIEDKNFR